MSDILRKRAMHASNTLGQRRNYASNNDDDPTPEMPELENAIDGNDEGGDEDDDVRDREIKPSGSSASSASRQFEVNTEKGGKRIMSEEEVSTLVHNALRRAREATSSVSPRRKSFANFMAKAGSPSSASAPKSPSSVEQQQHVATATTPTGLLVGRNSMNHHRTGASSLSPTSKPPTSPRQAPSPSHFFATHKEAGEETSTNTTPTSAAAGAAAAFPGGRRRTSRVPPFVSKYSNHSSAISPRTTLSSPASSKMDDTMNSKAVPSWDDERHKLLSRPSNTFSDDMEAIEGGISVDEEDYRGRPADLSVPTFSSVNSSDAIIRRVEEEIANARRAAQEANRRLAGVSADMNLSNPENEDDEEHPEQDQISTKTEETINLKSTDSGGSSQEPTDDTPSGGGGGGGGGGDDGSNGNNPLFIDADLNERKSEAVNNGIKSLLGRSVLESIESKGSSSGNEYSNSNRGTSAKNVIEILDGDDEGSSSPIPSMEEMEEVDEVDEADKNVEYTATASSMDSYEEANEEDEEGEEEETEGMVEEEPEPSTQKPPASNLTAEGNAFMKMLNKSRVPDNSNESSTKKDNNNKKPFTFPGRGRMISTGSSMGASEEDKDEDEEQEEGVEVEDEDEPQESSDYQQHEIVDLTNVDSPTDEQDEAEVEDEDEMDEEEKEEGAEAKHQFADVASPSYMSTKSRFSFAAESQLTAGESFQSALSAEDKSHSSGSNVNDPSSSALMLPTAGKNEEEEKKEDDNIIGADEKDDTWEQKQQPEDDSDEEEIENLGSNRSFPIEVSTETNEEVVEIDDIVLQDLMSELPADENENEPSEAEEEVKLVLSAGSEAEASDDEEEKGSETNENQQQDDDPEPKQEEAKAGSRSGSQRRGFWWNWIDKKEAKTNATENEPKTEEATSKESPSNDKAEDPPVEQPDSSVNEGDSLREDKTEELPPVVEQHDSPAKVLEQDPDQQENRQIGDGAPAVDKVEDGASSNKTKEPTQITETSISSGRKKDTAVNVINQLSFNEEGNGSRSAMTPPRPPSSSQSPAPGSTTETQQKVPSSTSPAPLPPTIMKQDAVSSGTPPPQASRKGRSPSPGPRAPSPQRVKLVEHRREIRVRDHETRSAISDELGIQEPKPTENIADRSKKVKFRQRYPVPPKIAKPSEPYDIIKRNGEEEPRINLILARPKPELKTLLDAVCGTSLQRRSNACGALKVLSGQKKNRLTLVRTHGFLDALVFAASAGISKKDREITKDSISRTMETMLNIAGPKDNRVIVFSHPGLPDVLVKCIAEDKGESRAIACATLATLAKTPYCRPPMAEVPGLVDILAKVLIGVGGKEHQEDDYGGDDEASELRKSFSSDSNYSSSTSSTGSSTRSDDDDERVHTPKLKSRREQKIQFNDEIAARARVNACAALVHLSKSCAVAPLLCANEGLMTALVQVSREYGNPIHTRCLEILCNMTRFPHNNARMAVFPGLVDSLVVSGRAKVDEDRVWSLRTLQNLSSDSVGKNVLANNIVLELLSVSVMRNHPDEQVAATATLFNLSTEPGAVVPLTNTKNVVATLVHVAHSPDSSSSVRLMACDALATLGLWLQTLAGAGVIPGEVQAMPLPSYVTAGWQRWE